MTTTPATDSGWTTIPLANGARAVYVSSIRGSDSNDGLTPNSPVRSPVRGYDLLRDRSGDQLLFACGDTWTWGEYAAPAIHKSGASAAQPLVFGSYSPAPHVTDRPIIESGVYYGLTLDGSRGAIENWALLGLDMRCTGHDRVDDVVGIDLVNGVRNVLIEDCRFAEYLIGVRSQLGASNLHFRRSSILDCYSTGGAHAQGLFCQGVSGLTLEDMILDRNGWNPDVPGSSPPDIFRHNTYITSDCRGVNITGCISCRASANGIHFRGGGSATGNLCIDNPANIAAGGDGDGSQDVTIDRNVCLGSRDLGYGIDLAAARHLSVTGNIVAHQRTPNLRSVRGLQLSGLFQSISATGNIVYDWRDPAHPGADVGFVPNYTLPLDVHATVQNQIGFPASHYPHPDRDIEGYLAAIGSPIHTRDVFFEAVRNQRRGHWNPKLTASAVNAWVRVGFVAEVN